MFIGLEAQSFESYPQGGREIWRQQRKGAVGREKKKWMEKVSTWDQIKYISKEEKEVMERCYIDPLSHTVLPLIFLSVLQVFIQEPGRRK